MTKETEEIPTVLLTEAEIAEFQYIWTVTETMVKHGCPCIFTKMEELVSYQEPHVHQKKLVLTFAVHTKEKNTLFSIFQDLERLTQDYTKSSKRSKTEWYLITDTQVDVVISKELK